MVSSQNYLMDPAKRATYEEEMAAIVAEERTRPISEMTREQVMEAVTKLEQAKFEAQQKMYYLVRHQKLNPQVINNVIKKEELKAGDKFFLDMGFEESEVEPNMKRLGLVDDAEIKEIITEYEQKSKDFLENKKKETEQMYREIVKRRSQVELQREAAKKEVVAPEVKAEEEKKEETTA